MKWSEFKKHVDLMLKEIDIPEEVELSFIDIHLPEVLEIGVDDGSLFCPSVQGDKDEISIM